MEVLGSFMGNNGSLLGTTPSCGSGEFTSSLHQHGWICPRTAGGSTACLCLYTACLFMLAFGLWVPAPQEPYQPLMLLSPQWGSPTHEGAHLSPGAISPCPNKDWDPAGLGSSSIQPGPALAHPCPHGLPGALAVAMGYMSFLTCVLFGMTSCAHTTWWQSKSSLSLM